MTSIKFEKKLKNLPVSSGVYFHKDKSGEIIYIGKAAVLKNRVKQYFQKSKFFDAKTKALIKEIYDVEWIETDSEIDALFLEAEMVKRYMPRYNILLRDDKSLIYIRINLNDDWPYVSFIRNPIDDGSSYFGPYYNSVEIKKAMRLLRRIFPYYSKPINSNMTRKQRNDLYDQIGLSPVGLSSSEYKSGLNKLIKYIQGKQKPLLSQLKIEMDSYAKKHEFEKAAAIRNKIYLLKSLKNQIMFGDKEFLDISKDQAINELMDILQLKNAPKRIEGFDISHMSGKDVVGSMVVFKNGVSSRKDYRKFKTKNDLNDDFYNIAEIIKRRFGQNNVKTWGLPDLVLIDGGKGQLSSAIKIRDELGYFTIPFIGLAKKDETLIIPNSLQGLTLQKYGGTVIQTGDFWEIKLPQNSHIIKLLQRIRDESHRFAISYHSTIKSKSQKRSILDEIDGVGPKTKKKLLKQFGSVAELKKANPSDVKRIIGLHKTKLVLNYLKSYNSK